MIKIHGLQLAIIAQDPTNPQEGQIWYNSTDDQLKFFDHNHVVQCINDIYNGVTPPQNAYEVLWCKSDESILFSYNQSQSKWLSIQKSNFSFNMPNRLYSGNFIEKYHIRNSLIITGIHTDCTDKTFILRADAIDLYQFNGPFDASDLFIDAPAGTSVVCYTPTQVQDNKQLFIENANVYVEAVWGYPS